MELTTQQPAPIAVFMLDQPEYQPTDDDKREMFLASLEGNCANLASAVAANPELYIGLRDLILEASNQLCRALDELVLHEQRDYHWRDGFMVRVK